MAERFTRQAAQQTNPVFAQSQEVIKPNLSATQKLFQNLVSGIQDQAASSTADITADAYSRGVGRASLAQDVASGFNPLVEQQAASLGAQKAGQLGDLQVAQGQLGVNRVNAISELASSLQASDLDNRQFEQDKIAQDRQQQLAIRQAEMQAAARAASRGGGGGGGGGGAPDIGNDIQAWMNTMRGADGNVSPDTYRQGLENWVAAGGDEASYHNKFYGFVNLQHPADYYTPGGEKAVQRYKNQAENIIVKGF